MNRLMVFRTPLPQMASSLGLLAAVPHIFTCVIPTLAALGGAGVGAGGGQNLLTGMGLGFLAPYHQVFLLAGTATALAGVWLTFRQGACACGSACACKDTCNCLPIARLRRSVALAVLLFIAALWLLPLLGGAHHAMPGMHHP